MGTESQSGCCYRESQETLRDVSAALGLKNVYTTTVATRKVTEDDYKACPDNMHEAGEIAKQFDVSLRIEFVRTSTFISTLTLVKMTARRHILSSCLCWTAIISGQPEQTRYDLDALKPGAVGHALSGRARDAARVAGPDNASDSRRWSQSLLTRISRRLRKRDMPVPSRWNLPKLAIKAIPLPAQKSVRKAKR